MATDTDQITQQMKQLIEDAQQGIKRAYDASIKDELYGRTFEQTVEARRVELTAAFKKAAREFGAQNDIFGEEFMESLAEIIIDAAVIQAEDPSIDQKDIYAASIRKKLQGQPNVPAYMVEIIILADKQTRQVISEAMPRMNDVDSKAGDEMEKALDRYMMLLTQSGLSPDLAEKLSNRALSGAMIEVLYNLSQKDEPLDIRQTLKSKGIASDAIDKVETSIKEIAEILGKSTARVLEGRLPRELEDVRQEYKAFSVRYLIEQGFDEKEAERIFQNNILKSADTQALDRVDLGAVSLEAEAQKIIDREDGLTIRDPWQEEEEKKELRSQTAVNTPPPASKSTQPARETMPSDGVKIIDRDIAPGERLEHTGPVKITANIGQGAHVTVTDGSINVTGKVHDNARLKTIGTQNTNVIRSFGDSVSVTTVISGGSIIVGTGSSVVIANTGNSKKLSVTVDGPVGNDVTIDAVGGITANNVGSGANFSSKQGDVVANDIGGGGRLHSGQGDVRVHDTGDRCTLDTGQGSVHANRVGKHCALRSGQGSVNAEFVDAHSSLRSGQGSVSAGTIHQTVRLHSGMGSARANNVIGSTPAAQTSQGSFANAQIVNGNISGMGSHTYNGDVIVTGNFSGMGTLTAKGSITIQGNASGMGSIEAEGDVSICGRFSGMGNVTSKNGNVYLGGGKSGMGNVTAPNGNVVYGLPPNASQFMPPQGFSL